MHRYSKLVDGNYSEKAGFITGFYVILVPVLGLVWEQRAGRSIWVGAIVALIGLYYLSVRENFFIARGDYRKHSLLDIGRAY